MRLWWTVLLAAALLWPSRTLSLFGGMPLDGTGEAIVIGLIVPALWWAHRQFLDGIGARALISTLLIVKCAGAVLLTQQGLCARFAVDAPFHTEVLTIPIDAADGLLKSWDVRAGWRQAAPACSAIVSRPYATLSAFPAWFLNITDFESGGRRAIALDVSGVIRVTEPGRFGLAFDRDMQVSGHVGDHQIAAQRSDVSVPLEAGVHPIQLRARLSGERWRMVPLWNDRDAFTSAALTVEAPRLIDRLLATPMAAMTTVLVLALAGAWLLSFVMAQRSSPWLVAWSAAATLVLIAVGTSGRLERLAGPFLFAGTLVPIAAPQRNLRGAFLLLGVPWLAFFAARALPLVGHFSIYSNDDWLVYQVAGYRIFMNGFWLQGGSNLFDYQALYRWITGALHLVFGDSSVGETYWDAACLLMGGLLAFQMVRSVSGFRAGVVAGAATLSTFTLGTIWYFVGRGLSETAASGFLFLAAFYILRARLGGIASAVTAGVLATLMFYARLNHLLVGFGLPLLLWPLGAPSRVRDWYRSAAFVRVKAAIVYATVFAAGVIAFAARTWWYTGVFSLFAGTSLKYNDTGLRLTTIGSLDVWRRVGHSLWALIWMNEPARPDVRAAFVATGVALAVLAVAQVPRVNRLPASIALAVCVAMISALFVHTHNYPGRMTIHLVPFAVALAVIAAARLFAAAASVGRSGSGVPAV